MKNISIKNYKNFKDLSINKLAKVNLVVGMNNCGKSTLLEAISIFLAGGSISKLKEILESRRVYDKYPRGEDEDKAIEAEIENFLTLYTDLNLELFYSEPIEFIGNIQNEDIKISIKFVDIYDEREFNGDGESILRRKIIDPSESNLLNVDTTKALAIYINDDLKKTYLFKNHRLRQSGQHSKFSCEYVQTSHISSERNPIYFDSIAMSDLENELIKSLNIIDERIDAINFLRDSTYSGMHRYDRVPIVVLKGSSKRYKLSTMGDGINRILTIILAMLNCKDGVLLVDEFDNGLHYSVQTKLWKIVYHLANVLNIQVFATTHSNDCIKSFIEAEGDVSCKIIRLENRDGNIVSVDYDDKEELDIISSSNIEIR